MKKFFILIIGFALIGYNAQSQKSNSIQVQKDLIEQVKFYEKRVFISQNDELRYLQLINQRGNEKLPLIIYLHSGDANGIDNEKQLTHSPKIITDSVFRATYGFHFIAPQCKPKNSWVIARKWKDGGKWVDIKMNKSIAPQLELVKALVDSLCLTNNIDEKRIYLIGASMGGFGTWDLICRYQTKFAAAVPICGFADTLMAKYIADIPIWVFHGAMDAHVDVQYSRAMVNAIKNAGGNPKYTEFPDLPHDIRDTVYNNKEVWDWMFSQRLK
jgi:predicted peptidase